MTRSALILIPAVALAVVATALPAQTARPDGALIFRQRCGSCHNMTPGAKAVLAPSLIGVANRKAGTTAFNYSPALKASNLVWNRANLDRYIAAPMRTVPGTRMVMAITDPAQRAAVINYLAPAPAAPTKR